MCLWSAIGAIGAKEKFGIGVNLARKPNAPILNFWMAHVQNLPPMTRPLGSWRLAGALLQPSDVANAKHHKPNFNNDTAPS